MHFYFLLNLKSWRSLLEVNFIHVAIKNIRPDLVIIDYTFYFKTVNINCPQNEALNEIFTLDRPATMNLVVF